MFIGRDEEIRILEEDFHSKKSAFCVLYGRRRIGKSTLLKEFSKLKPAFYFQAGREAKKLQLQRFAAELGDRLNDPLTARTMLNEWEEALMLVDRAIAGATEKRKGKKTLIIFDEFQWMCTGSPELISGLQRFWDNRWKDSANIFLILCGSSISFMLGEVLSRKSPLFGRRTRSIHLGPFLIQEASKFLSGRNRFEVAETYMVSGGVPEYLEVLDSRESFRRTLAKTAFSSQGFFFDEVNFVLSEQLKEKEQYFRVLEELAVQPREIADLSRRTAIPTGQITYYMERLQLLGFVSRHMPVGASATSKKVRYRLDDYFLRFYFSFIHPLRGGIAGNLKPVSFHDAVGKKWDVYAGYAFENIARDHAVGIAKTIGYEGGVRSIGSYWQHATKRKPGVQIDLIIECSDKTTLLCECKWSRKKIGLSAVNELRRKAACYRNRLNHSLKLVLIASAGVTRDAAGEKDVAIVTLDDIFNINHYA